ncbi:771483a9-c85d-4611-a955-aec3ad2f87ee [Thermothielavioides terrestris]|uniref:771483a9-c85d-4611-a955-aec3ad2f87ee n=1 Tax=Thermothielavioides terrestris TaxID=2587410 RepID=A0A446BA53_9PEZI|nr:771483a9-c85d-4611-a955-aec3ad2f87ee [Thermothielavioides terrestris]
MAPSRVEYQYFGPPVPPKDVPSFPPEDQEGSWYPQHPDMAPAPLSLRSKAQNNAPRPLARQQANGHLDGYKPDPLMTIPSRKPVQHRRAGPASFPATDPTRCSTEETGRAHQPREKQKIDGSTRQRAQQQQQQQQQQPRPGGGGPQPQPRPNRSQARSSTTSQSSGSKNKKPSWLKRLVGAPSTASLDSVEFVSLDAARIERSLTPRRGP